MPAIDKSTRVASRLSDPRTGRQLSRLGFTHFIRTRDGEELDLVENLRIAIHVESAITDGPGGDSAIVISDGQSRLVNQNDCRTRDLAALRLHGPVDMHWLQFSGAIWYPMVYEDSPDNLMALARAKVESQFSRALHYVSALDARVVMPSAGPPCFLDAELFGFNMITGDELSIFPDQTKFIARLLGVGNDRGVLNIPGTTVEVTADSVRVIHPTTDEMVRQPFDNKAAYLRAYQADWAPWLARHKASWPTTRTDLIATLRDWWQPLLTMAPTLRQLIGHGCVLDLGDLKIHIDFLNGEVGPYGDQPFGFRFTIQRALVEAVVAAKAIDWSTRSCCRVASEPGAKVNSMNTSTTSSRVCRSNNAPGRGRSRSRSSPQPEVLQLNLATTSCSANVLTAKPIYRCLVKFTTINSFVHCTAGASNLPTAVASMPRIGIG